MDTICLDTTILIEHYRCKDKSRSSFYKLSDEYNFKIPSVVKYEILCGDKKKDKYWNNLFKIFEILPFDDLCADIAAEIYLNLKQNNGLIPIDDILIASISIRNHLKLASLNNEHFRRIHSLEIIKLIGISKIV
jgi:tRNA(fMet)-specific endonuclease VapC